MAHDTVPPGSAFDKSGQLRRPENLMSHDTPPKLSTLEQKLNKLPADRRAKIEQRALELIESNGAITFDVWFRSAVNEQADAMIEDITSLNHAKALAEENIQAHGFNVANIIGYDEDSNKVYDVNIRRGRSQILYE